MDDVPIVAVRPPCISTNHTAQPNSINVGTDEALCHVAENRKLWKTHHVPHQCIHCHSRAHAFCMGVISPDDIDLA